MSDDLTGSEVAFEWQVSQADVSAFAALVGDDHPIHVDAGAALAAGLPGTIMQGTMLVGLMGKASTRFFRESARHALAVGFDRVRFLRPVPMGVRLTVRYRIAEHARGTGRLAAEVTVANEGGETVAVARHLALLI